MEKLCFEIDEKVYSEVGAVLDDIGLEIPDVVNAVLKRIIREGSVEFIFKKNPVSDSVPSGIAPTKPSTASNSSEYISTASFSLPLTKITKNIAKSIFARKGHAFDAPVVFSSRNKATRDYWANPRVDIVNGDWYLILNDQYNRKLYLFKIDRSITESRKGTPKLALVPRVDMPHLINLQIFGDDTVYFEDRISGEQFHAYLIDKEVY